MSLYDEFDLHFLVIFQNVWRTLENTYTCDSASNCENTLGGYDCRCKEGYYKTAQGTCAGNHQITYCTHIEQNML